MQAGCFAGRPVSSQRKWKPAGTLAPWNRQAVYLRIGLAYNDRHGNMTGPLEDRREELLGLCRAFGVARLDAFGSAAGTERFDPERSDIDLLVEFEPMDPIRHAKSYFGLLAALQDLFDRRIDLLEAKAVTNPYLLESIEKQRRRIYAA